MTLTFEAWRDAVDLFLWSDFCQRCTDEEAAFWYDTGVGAEVAAVRIEDMRGLAR